jgi:hypothetical protein
MKDRRYTARPVQNFGRKGWVAEFRHPLMYEAGRPGRKVRRGLDETDEAEALKLTDELNELLADETFHSINAMNRARERFSHKVVEIFYGGLQSGFAVYRGTKFVGMHRPVMVVTANAAVPGNSPPLSEHFVFCNPTPSGSPNREVCRSTLYTCDDGANPRPGADFPNLLSIEAMIQGESGMGREHFAHHIWEKDKALHKQLFWPDAPAEPFDFGRLEEAPLLMMLLSGPFANELQWMLTVTENQSLRELRNHAKRLSGVRLQQKQIG